MNIYALDLPELLQLCTNTRSNPIELVDCYFLLGPGKPPRLAPTSSALVWARMSLMRGFSLVQVSSRWQANNQDLAVFGGTSGRELRAESLGFVVGQRR